jgi:protein-L-isoaspartate O-methyltransferase
MRDLNPALHSTAGYSDEADGLAMQYESITFAQAHRPTLHLIPSKPSRVLDIGAGTGRDAAALTALGHRVTAVEPTAELRAHGQRLHAGSEIRWIDDSLPDLSLLSALGGVYDLVLLTAVWMHLDESERMIAFGRLCQIVESGGLVIMSLRHGPVPAGRMFDVSGHETERLARQHGFVPTFRTDQPDMLDRADVSWTYLALRRS